MKIVYCIYVGGHGRGGHTYSLLETATKVGKEANAIIVSIGVGKSPVLEHYDGQYFHIKDQGTIKTAKALSQLAKKEGATVLHAFDVKAFFYARLVSIKNRLPLLLTKCGGPNPKRYYPYHSQIVLFSQENKDFFTQRKKFKNTQFPVIANRVESNKDRQDYVRINELKQHLVPNVPIILRINRIGGAYIESINQGVSLVKGLIENGVHAQLLVIGVVEDQAIFEELRSVEGKYITFVTDDRYTVNASQLIDVADLVIGTGRGFMEASLMGKTMLSPTDNLHFPILVTKERVGSIFAKNFSQRYIADISSEEALEDIRSVLINFDKDESVDISSFADENFSSGNLYNKYAAVYESAEPARLHIFDLVMHWFYYSGIMGRVKYFLK